VFLGPKFLSVLIADNFKSFSFLSKPLDQPILFEIEDNANILHLCQKLEPITAIPLYEIKIEKLGKGIDNNELISDVLDVGTSEDLGTDAELSVLHGSSFVAKIKFYKQAHKNGEPLSHEYYGLPQQMIKVNIKAGEIMR